MAWPVTKYFATAAVVVLVSGFARRSGRLGALVGALPLASLLAPNRLRLEEPPPQKIADLAWYTFRFVVPTLPVFLAFPALLPRIGFWPAPAACVLVTIASFVPFAPIVRRFGIELP